MQLVSLSALLTHFSTAAPKHEETRLRDGKKEEEKEGEKRTNIDITSCAVHSELRWKNDTKRERERQAKKCEHMRNGRWTDRKDRKKEFIEKG